MYLLNSSLPVSEKVADPRRQRSGFSAAPFLGGLTTVVEAAKSLRLSLLDLALGIDASNLLNLGALQIAGLKAYTNSTRIKNGY